MPTSVLDIEDHNHLRVLRLNRPERKNALNGPLFQAINDALRAGASDPDVWALALTGNGDAFCSGLDLSEASETDDSDGADLPPEPDEGDPWHNRPSASSAGPRPRRTCASTSTTRSAWRCTDCRRTTARKPSGP